MLEAKPATRVCEGIARARFATLPTPLEDAPRLARALGARRVLVKREDLAGLCSGGNKARLMEFVIGALAERGVDAVVASAAPHSNKLREIAAAACRYGMRAVFLLPAERDALAPQGNRLLLDLLGAELHVLEAGDDEAVLEQQRALGEMLEREGHVVAVLDRRLEYGTLATLAYVDAAEELAAQLRGLDVEPATLYVTAGAGMTLAGLALGLVHLGVGIRIVGVCVARPAAPLAAEIVAHAARAAVRLGLSTRIGTGDFRLVDRHDAPPYGCVTAAIADMVRLVARAHGMVLDPVYNAKTMCAVLDEIAAGRESADGGFVFVNTGGGPGLFAHNVVLSGA